jgi:hypothetical protein
LVLLLYNVYSRSLIHVKIRMKIQTFTGKKIHRSKKCWNFYTKKKTKYTRNSYWLIIYKKNFTYNSSYFITFTIKYSNFKKWYFKISIFQFFIFIFIFSISTLLYNFSLNLVKILKIPVFFFFFFFKKEKNYKDLGIDQNLTKFIKILMRESLKNYIY